LHIAADCKNSAAATALVSKGAKVDVKDRCRRAPKQSAPRRFLWNVLFLMTLPQVGQCAGIEMKARCIGALLRC
jgi:hypothetical protein